MGRSSIDSRKETQKTDLLRKRVLDIIYQSKASHIGSSFSVIEILSAVYRGIDIKKIKDKRDDRDRVILSKGHSAAALYVILNHLGLLSDEELMTYYKNGSILSGHASHFVPYVEHSTGALGHGLSVAVGIGIGLKSKGLDSRVYVIVGDGELHEGSNWEALLLAGHLKLDNLCVLVDMNGLGGTKDINSYCSFNSLKDKLESFCFKTFEVDGHDEEQICQTIQRLKESETPGAIICHTIKGKGVSFMENNNVWHYRPPNDEEYKKASIELSKRRQT
ncbi:MAG: transketolase [Thermoplasmata archaeon]|nr:transketolase [Thermoplasmata archaeon]MBE3139795.1 transketolase [Thermoplasmata archaeon]